MRETKKALRSRFNLYRHTLTDAEYRHLSARIIEQAAGLREIREATVVHLYWPLINRREVDTRSLIDQLRAQGKEVILPIVVSFGAPTAGTARMQHVRYLQGDDLRLNQLGIAEPMRREPVSVNDLDVVVAPALGAGRNGHRIGYGYGYYDEFLAGTPVPKIALVYDACLVDEVPDEGHDVAMDVLVTESNIVRPRRLNSRSH